MITSQLYQESMSTYRSSMEQIKIQIHDLKQENMVYQEKLVASNNEQLSQQNLAEKMKNKNENLQKEKMKILDELNDAQLHLEKSKEENLQSCELVCKLEMQVEKFREDMFDLEKQSEARDYELKHLDANLTECLRQKEFLAEKCKMLESNLEQKEKDCNAMRKDRTEHFNEKANEIKDLQSKIDVLEQEKLCRLNLCQTLEAKIKALEKDIDSISSKHSKLRVGKKKLQAMFTQLQEENVENQKKIDELAHYPSSLKLAEDKIALVEGHVARLKDELKEQIYRTESTSNQLEFTKQQNQQLEKQLNETIESNSMLNQSVDNLEIELNEKKHKLLTQEEEKNKSVTSLQKFVNKLQVAKQRTEQDLQLTRNELKELRKNVSVLKQENLEKEFTIQELLRSTYENQSLLKIKDNEEEYLRSKCQEKSTELEVLKEKQRSLTKQENEKSKHEQKESQLLLDLMHRINIRHHEDKKNMADNHDVSLLVSDLEKQTKEYESSLRAEKMEKFYLQEELLRLRVNNCSSTSKGKSL